MIKGRAKGYREYFSAKNFKSASAFFAEMQRQPRLPVQTVAVAAALSQIGKCGLT